ncbi:DNA-binding transcriptional regulator, MerR family [Collimonas sp. OK607]|uniref:MerR family transcriptional regulator n=1 Tax=Collimonas sp. OK607 TaxID=1798194 RepID=UPI0008EA7424|nr:MerR family transcriptional regulator [Collimonas sp. OK607]SFB07476.1 DNA-binding transcriptional regulator, MerR family [Collimonas sp. OK607]
MRIGSLASASGLSRDTLRFYEERGLIRSARGSNGYRIYHPETVEILRYIRTAQKLGFSLNEIGASLPDLLDTPAPDAAVAALLMEKVAIIDQKIAELADLKRELLGRVALKCPLLSAPEAG